MTRNFNLDVVIANTEIWRDPVKHYDDELQVTTMAETPYADYRFLGIKSFIEALESSGTEYRLFDDDYSGVYRQNTDILTPGEDTIRSGIMLREGQSVYFTEFGIKLTKSYRAYLVFIFSHHPTAAEVESIAGNIESLVEKGLEGVNITELTDSIEKKRGTLQ